MSSPWSEFIDGVANQTSPSMITGSIRPKPWHRWFSDSVIDCIVVEWGIIIIYLINFNLFLKNLATIIMNTDWSWAHCIWSKFSKPALSLTKNLNTWEDNFLTLNKLISYVWKIQLSPSPDSRLAIPSQYSALWFHQIASSIDPHCYSGSCSAPSTRHSTPWAICVTCFYDI